MSKKVGVMVKEDIKASGLRIWIQNAGFKFSGEFSPRVIIDADILVVDLSIYSEACRKNHASIFHDRPTIVIGAKKEMTPERVRRLVSKNIQGIADWNIQESDFAKGLKMVANGEHWVWEPLARHN